MKGKPCWLTLAGTELLAAKQFRVALVVMRLPNCKFKQKGDDNDFDQ
jgi:hypothetical protein